MLDVGDILAIAEMFVVVDAPNRRLVRTLVDEIEEAVRAATGRSPRRVEGVKEQQWVLIDYGDVVVHVFLDEIRRFYEIERLYRDAPAVVCGATPTGTTVAADPPGGPSDPQYRAHGRGRSRVCRRADTFGAC